MTSNRTDDFARLTLRISPIARKYNISSAALHRYKETRDRKDGVEALAVIEDLNAAIDAADERRRQAGQPQSQESIDEVKIWCNYINALRAKLDATEPEMVPLASFDEAHPKWPVEVRMRWIAEQSRFLRDIIPSTRKSIDDAQRLIAPIRDFGDETRLMYSKTLAIWDRDILKAMKRIRSVWRQVGVDMADWRGRLPALQDGLRRTLCDGENDDALLAELRALESEADRRADIAASARAGGDRKHPMKRRDTMPRPNRIPAIIESLLKLHKAPPPPPDLQGASFEDMTRLKHLCEEMVSRIMEETDDTRFGDIDGQIEEAAELAQAIGFSAPPLERVRYDRGTDYTPKAGDQVTLFGWGSTVMNPPWSIYQCSHPKFVQVFGYRFHDPDQTASPIEVHISAVAETDDPTKPQTDDPWKSTPKTEHRSEAVKYLRRWVRFIDRKHPVAGDSLSRATHIAPQAEALRAIATELRTLPNRGDSAGERLESAGRLLLAAITAGAFAAPQHAAFLAMVHQRAAQTNVNGPISAWTEACWHLAGKPSNSSDPEKTFPADCGRIADLIEAQDNQATSMPTPAQSGGKPAGNNEGRNEDGLDGEAKVLALLVQHPDWTDTQLAGAAGVNRTSLYRMERFTQAKAAMRGQANGNYRQRQDTKQGIVDDDNE